MSTPESGRSTLVGLIRTTRPHQWTKNLLVFAAPVAGGLVTEADVALRTGGAFVAFCLAAGGTYLLNDALDVEADRAHPTKCNRPIAAGQVSVGLAYAVGAALLVAAVVLSFAIAPALGATTLAYLVLTTAYSFVLKSVAIVDLVAVASGFVLRAVAGAAATAIPLSEWFFIIVSAGALLMIAAKREGELHNAGAEPTPKPIGDDDTDAAATRKVLDQYTAGFLASVRSIAAGLALIAYCMWTFESSVADAEVALRLSIAPFTVAILRYALLADQGKGEEPERLVLEDRTLLVAGVSWAIIYAYAIYLA